MTMKNSKIWLGAAAVLAVAGGGVAIAQTAPGAGPGPRAGKAGMMMMADANKDGVISRAEANAAATARFQQMDANKDGKIDQADRDAMRAQRKAQAFDRLDTNKDGSVSKSEFDARRAAPADGQGRRGDGMRGMRGGKGHMGGQMGGKRGGMMAGADTNGDKAISLAEFQAAHNARFDAMDANKDGNVTQAEMTAHRAAMKAQWQSKRAAPQNNNAN